MLQLRRCVEAQVSAFGHMQVPVVAKNFARTSTSPTSKLQSIPERHSPAQTGLLHKDAHSAKTLAVDNVASIASQCEVHPCKDVLP